MCSLWQQLAGVCVAEETNAALYLVEGLGVSIDVEEVLFSLEVDV